MQIQNEIQQQLLADLDAKYYELKYNKISALFPEIGPYARNKYLKHIAFLNAGYDFNERAFIAANRTGKTTAGAYEMTCHLTGIYPDWWKGRRFKSTIDAWAAGISNQSTKEVIQQELLGDINDIGSGMIPRDKIATKSNGDFMLTKKPGVADSIETIYVKHISGDLSKLTFKSYEQGYESFQGTKKQVIWLDEEPKDPKIYTECLTRLMDKYNPGLIYCTFTPLFGMSDVVKSFIPQGVFPKNGVDKDNPHKYIANVTWDDIPHMSEEQKISTLKAYAPHEREARSKGIPSLGAGAVYPYLEDDIIVEPFAIPDWWPRGYGLDTGWKKTAAIWGALDPDSGVVYLYSEYYVGQERIPMHASAIKGRGDWLIGAADPAGLNPADGTKMFELFEAEGLNLIKADKRCKEAGIAKICTMFEAGQIKIFSTLENWLWEKRAYARSEEGKLPDKNDHLMDAMLYFIVTGLDWLELPPNQSKNIRETLMGKYNRDVITGY